MTAADSKNTIKMQDKKIDDILSGLLVFANKIEEKAILKNSEKDLTISEIHVLREIPGEIPKKMSQIAEGLRISVGALTTAIDKLTDKGYVKRFRGKTDKRTMKVMLTPKGKEAYRKHEKFHKDMVEAAVADLSEEEKKILQNVLMNIEQYFIEEEKKYGF